MSKAVLPSPSYTARTGRRSSSTAASIWPSTTTQPRASQCSSTPPRAAWWRRGGRMPTGISPCSHCEMAKWFTGGITSTRSLFSMHLAGRKAEAPGAIELAPPGRHQRERVDPSASEGGNMASSLSIDVFNSGYKPIPAAPGWDDSTPATWPASTSTLISGDRDALLVDALLTTSEGQRLAAWVQNTGKRPRAIFVTHGHGDHFFGAGPVLDAFPTAGLIACDQQVVDQARGQTTPQAIASWNTRFAGQFSQSPTVPALAGSPEFDLEGHPLQFRRIGGADGVLATIVHVP